MTPNDRTRSPGAERLTSRLSAGRRLGPLPPLLLGLGVLAIQSQPPRSAQSGREAARFFQPVVAAGSTAVPVAIPLAAPAAAIAPSSPAKTSGWVDVDYGALVDRRRLSHSGESVGMLLQRLEGRSFPPRGERPEDATAHILLDPLLEPYAFVLADALDSLTPPGRPLVEVGELWQPGEAQPGWAELLRSRHFLVESDGTGRFRLCLPWPMPRAVPRAASADSPSGNPAPGDASDAAAGEAADRVVPADLDSVEAGRQAWEASWPVLRHMFAAERRRLARAAGDAPENHPLEVDVHPYLSLQAKTLFRLGTTPYHAKIEDTRPRGDRPALDLGAWQSFLDRGLRLEGGRLIEDGTIRLLGSDEAVKPTFLGRSLALSDFAVAYRAVFHGGLGEPYMSLDRGGAPQTSLVNYGGRLHDTSLGLVSLLCDIRFKTFSLGIDILANQDLRGRLRRDVPSFKTHMERFAADARSKGVVSQQTRLWFYPDAVDLTLSPEDDVLVMRRVRMSASSEHIQQETFTTARAPDPPWTAATVAAINGDYGAFVGFFPELGDLDEVVRLLSFFTWLKQAGAEGIALPDLDVLLALELPAEPTPRHFPQLLTYSLLPPSADAGPVEAFNRVSVGEALDRLLPSSGAELPAARRFQRALAALDRRVADHAKLAQELDGYDPKALDEGSLDLLSYRAERLRMHYLVHNTLPDADRKLVERRKSETEGTRSLETGIGGLDLGMSQALARASGRNQRTTIGGASTAPGEAGSAERPGAEAPPGPRARAAGASSRRAQSPSSDPAVLPPLEMPGHGLGAKPPQPGAAGKGSPVRGLEDARDHWIEAGASPAGSTPGAPASSWIQTVMGADGPDPRSRRLILSDRGSVRAIERLEDGRFLRYRMESEGGLLRARPVSDALPAEAARRAADPRRLFAVAGEGAGAAELPAGLVSLEMASAAPGGADGEASKPETESQATEGAAEPASLRLKLRGIAGKELEASVPRTILQRLVLGHEADLTPDRPLPGLSPASKILAGNRRVMVMASPGEVLPPWSGPSAPIAGEEDAARIASALARWWSAESDAQPAPTIVVGTDKARSPERWRSASSLGGSVALVLPDRAFPGAAGPIREKLAAAWKPGQALSAIPTSQIPSLVVLVSAEDPALFGARLRELARSAAMKGRLLAAWPLGGPVRPDLPASLLAEGNLAGLAVAAYSPLSAGRAADELELLAEALAGADAKRKRPEDLPPPLLWYF